MAEHGNHKSICSKVSVRFLEGFTRSRSLLFATAQPSVSYEDFGLITQPSMIKTSRRTKRAQFFRDRFCFPSRSDMENSSMDGSLDSDSNQEHQSLESVCNQASIENSFRVILQVVERIGDSHICANLSESISLF
jgi:hypothetical protein